MTSPATPVEGSSGSRRFVRFVAGAAVVLVVLGLAAAVVAGRGPDDPVDDALDLARPERGYDTGLEAGRTLARVASALNRGIRDCDRETEPDRCAALGAVSGYVQVTAARVVRCTAPGRSEARQRVLDLLEDLDTRRAGDPPPTPPPIPSCRG